MVDKKIVAKMIELYVSRKKSFIMMTRDGNIFMPKIGNRFMRLSVSNIERHLEHQYAISVFAVETGSKFICMDIDHGGLPTVQKVMASLLDIGFEHNMLHISTSGGKGFHIEIFFTAIVPYASLIRLYKHVLDSTGATEDMIEMRPTYKQGIKLPLSIHPRTGNICWFVDHELFEPIERQDYILEIVPVAVDVFEMIIKDLPEPIKTTRVYKDSGEWKPVEWGNLLEPAEEGTRHKPAWRDHMERNIGLIATAITADTISIDVGYDADGKSDEVRAMIVAHGSGDKADGGGSPITAGPPGRSVWDGDLSGKYPSKAKSTYELPDAFNQQGNQFVEDAMRRMQTQFGDAIDQAFIGMPDSVIHTKVRVDET